ncbi:tRNA/rRNA methyltransferase [Comamonas sp. BIGb0152]|uniref:RNA methyltransferase n=1 Tax=Comamonas sp. BIGb0152 TaxID=2940601 RepID=UPI002168834C|nr:RNA methyltransferase [Comamonas sp. BIGb0152]MCS4293390.1 tRNA/rRNA methyltransferase [Comamonas sp. BIGb0152]
MKTRFVLIETSHAGNVGAAARAIKTMGFDDLVLVRPRWSNVLRKEETIQRASGALDVLANCRVVETVEEALDGMSHLCATAMTPRDFGPPARTPREHFALLLQGALAAQPAPSEQAVEAVQAADGALAPSEAASSAHPSGETGVAFLFGCERYGMANEDVYRCNVALSIPTNPDFGSLNLASAVQVVAYDWRQALGGYGVSDVVARGERADAQQVAGMLAHWQQALAEIGFLDLDAPKKLMPRLNQMFNRAQLSQEEIHILRGVAKAMLRTAEAAKR